MNELLSVGQEFPRLDTFDISHILVLMHMPSSSLLLWFLASLNMHCLIKKIRNSCTYSV